MIKLLWRLFCRHGLARRITVVCAGTGCLYRIGAECLAVI